MDTSPASPSPDDHAAGPLFRLSIGVFFIGGFLSALVALLVPRMRETMGLDYAQAMLIQFAFHSSYLLFAAPATLFILRSGYMRAIATGLAIMGLGCAAFAFAHAALDYALVLTSLLLLSAGITFLQIASNTVVTVIGPSRNAAARLTLLQGFNSLGTVLGPLLGAQFLLGGIDAPGGGRAGSVIVPFVVSAAILAVLSLTYVVRRNLLGSREPVALERPSLRRVANALRDWRLRAGSIAMFAYVGAEVAIGTLLTNFLMLPATLDLAPVEAGRMVSLYWAGAMVGRFGGAALLRRIAPARLLVLVALGAAALTLCALSFGGPVGAGCLLAVGACNAIMYPTIFALALPADEREAPIASMILCVAVVGGALVPLLAGIVADLSSLFVSLLIPAACYLGIARFADRCARQPKAV